MKLGERKCPRCAETIKVDARVCKHCGAEFSDQEIASVKQSDSRKQTAVGLGCLSLIALIVLPLAMCSADDAGNDTTSAGDVEAAKGEFATIYQSVMAVSRTCDADNGKAIDAINAVVGGAGSRVDAYAAASQAEESCRNASVELAKIEPPANASPVVRKSIEETLDTCSLAYTARQQGLKAVMKAVDGDSRPSVVAEFQQHARSSQAGVLACVAGLYEGGSKLGVDMSKINKGSR